MKKFTAVLLLIAFINELFFPLYGYALTSGPTQPESSGFQQMDQMDLVDLFTGDSKYNIPLLDVDGYPLNLTYSGNVGMEQEASWVGLGWNLQVGSITRSVNGVPDDFKNDLLQEFIERRPRRVVTLKAAPTLEFFGRKMNLKSDFFKNYSDKISPDLAIKWSNYDGFGLAMNLGIKPDLFKSNIQLNLGFDSQNGVSAGTSLAAVHKVKDKELGDLKFSGSLSFGMNSQGGIQGLSFNTTADKFSGLNGSTRNRDTYTRGVDPQTTSTYYSFELAPIGKDGYGANKDITVTGTFSETALITNNFSTPTAGYLHLQNAERNAITDYSKEADPVYNEDVKYLPVPSMTYDGYSVSAHGLGGTFRPYRNEVAPVGDPQRSFDPELDNQSNSVSVDFGISKYVKLGTNIQNTTSNSFSDKFSNHYPFRLHQFVNRKIGKVFEPVYFKFEDEASILDKEFYARVGFDEPIALKMEDNELTNQLENSLGNLATEKFHNSRVPRAKVIRSFTLSDYRDQYIHYKRESKAVNSFDYGINTSAGDSKDDNAIDGYAAHKLHGFEISDESGKQYGFFIPALNTKKIEVSFSILNGGSGNQETIQYTNAMQDRIQTNDQFYSRKFTGVFAHTFLLTHIKGQDYVDVKNDGFTDDDLGSFTQFRYTCTSKDYKWRAPYENKTAKLMPNSRLTNDDDKANYTYGEKEVWYVNSVVGRHHIAIFKISPRSDGVGVANEDGGLPSNVRLADRLYKLDEIILFNKSDFYSNGEANAKILKRVKFNYSYELCKGVPNFSKVNINDNTSDTGKLTLKSVQIAYGNSNKGYLTPYSFEYANNGNYNSRSMDRWGNFQTYSGDVGPGDFPYTFQDSKSIADQNASKWLLTRIKTPGGSITTIKYESDDYAYVQDKKAMRMFNILGFTDSPNPNADIKHQLGGMGDRDNHYVVVKLSNEPIPNWNDHHKFRQVYLSGIEHMAFSVMTKVAFSSNGNGGYERVKGYAKIDPMASFMRDPYSCFIKIVPRKVSKVMEINGMMYSIINYAQINLGRFINPGNNPNNSDLRNIVNSIISIVGEIIKLAADPKLVYYNQGVGKYMQTHQSWVRLNIGNGRKFGGGARVKSVETTDSWSAMVDDAIPARSAVYGQIYEYTMPGEANESSGVATYEPFIGGDENPFRQPHYYLSTNTFSNKVYDFQELPLGESYFPSPSVGYSHVTVKNMHYQYAPSSREFSVSEFYTAKDCPVIVRSTGIYLKPRDPRLSVPLFKESYYLASQGYSIVTNSMHGKEKSTTTYLGDNHTNARSIHSTRYYYANLPVGGQGGVNGKVNTMLAKLPSNLGADAEWSQEYLNRQIEIIWNPQYMNETQFTSRYDFDLEVLPAGIFPAPIPIPILFAPPTTATTKFMSNCIVKHVDYRPILVKTESKSLGKFEEIENLVFEFLNGVATLKNVFTGGLRTSVAEVPYHLITDDRKFSPLLIDYTYPAPAYSSIDFQLNTTMNNGVFRYQIPVDLKFVHDNIFDVGDFVLVQNPNITFHAWVASVKRVYGPIGTNLPTTEDHCPYWLEVTLIDKNGMYFPQQNIGTNGNYTFKILDKGNKNISGVKCFSFVSTLPNFFKHNQYLSYEFVEYANGSVINKRIESSGYTPSHVNPFLNGQQVGFDFNKSYNFFGDRMYNHSFINMQGELKLVPDDRPFYLRPTCTNSSPSKFIAMNYPLRNVWRNLIAPTKTDVNGSVIETKDNENRYNAAVYSDVSRQIVASAKHAHNSQILAEGFEEFNTPLINGYTPFIGNRMDLVNYPVSIPYTVPSARFNDKFVASTAAHTGKYSLRINQGANYSVVFPKFSSVVPTPGGLGTLEPNSLDGLNVGFSPWLVGGTYRLSVWVRDNNYLRTNDPFGQTVQFRIGTQPFMTFGPTGPIINGWQKIEFEFTISPTSNVNGLELVFRGGTNGGWFDDLRIFPKGSTMTAYVYDNTTRNIRAILDENNYATFYEYNESLEMVRTKKETERGIFTLKEDTKSVKHNN